MKKTRILAALLAGIMVFTGVPQFVEPMTVTSYAASAKLAAPTGIKATCTDTTIKLSWNKVSGADAYKVYMYNSKTGKYEKYKNIAGTSCTVKGLTANTKYKFKLAALVKSGNSYKEQTKTAVINISTSKKEELLPPPEKVSLQSSNSSISISWSAVKGADAYAIYIAPGVSDVFELYKNISNTNYTLNDLKANTPYKIKIAALKKKNGKYITQSFTERIHISLYSKKATTVDKESVINNYPPVVFTPNNLMLVFGQKYYLTKINNTQSDYYNKPVVAYPVRITNYGDSTQSHKYYNDYVYDYNWNELDDIQILMSAFHSYLSPLMPGWDLYDRLEPGESMDAVFYFIYVGDGDYHIGIKQNYSRSLKSITLPIRFNY